MHPSQYNLTRAAYSVNQLIETGAVGGRTSIYEAIKRKELKATKHGKRTLFLAPHVAEFLDALTQSTLHQVNDKVDDGQGAV